jgi:hypothetical protein
MNNEEVVSAPVDRAQLRISRRFVISVLVLMLLQLLSVFAAVVEGVSDRQPAIYSVLASAVVVIGWLALAALAGRHRLSAFVWLASAFWTVVAVIIGAAMLAVHTAADSVESGLGPIAPLVMIFVVMPLDALAQLIPIEDQLARCLLLALGVLAGCLAIYARARSRSTDPGSAS